MNGISRLIAGDAARGAASIEEALALADDLEVVEQVQQAGGGAVFLGDWTRARRYFDRAIVLARDRGAIALLPETLGLRALIALWERRLVDAAADADEAMRLADDIGASNARTLPVTALAWLAGLRGDEDECRRLADEVLALSLERGLALPAGLATWALAQLDLAAGRWDEALLRLTAIEQVRPGFGHPFLPVLSSWDRLEAAVHAGRPDVAQQTLERFAPWAQAAAAPWAVPVLADCRALAAAPDAADAHFEAAIQSIDRAGTLDRARIHLHYGEYLRRERRRIDARVHLRAAFDGFEWLGAAPWAERALRELRATGEKARKRHLSPLAELTPQELQVARLVGDGATNKDVASQLFVEPQDGRVPPAQGVRQARDLLADGARRARARGDRRGARLTAGRPSRPGGDRRAHRPRPLAPTRAGVRGPCRGRPSRGARTRAPRRGSRPCGPPRARSNARRGGCRRRGRT